MKRNANRVVVDMPASAAARKGCVEPLLRTDQRAEDTEVDEQIGEDGPAEGRRRRKDPPALDDEHDGEEHGRKRGDAEHHAPEQRERVDVVAIGVGLPEIELGQRGRR